MSQDIPADIARTARALADELLDRYLDMGLVSSLPHIERDIAALAIAKVIDAERERCAAIAQRMLMFADTTSEADWEIAAAIRGDAT